MEHRIIQYTLDGDFVKVWDNANQAAESGADTAGLIRKCLMGRGQSAKLNYQWAFYTPDYRKKIRKKDAGERVGRMQEGIEELDWSGNVVATYKDTSEAARKSGCSQSYVCNVLAGKIRRPKHRFRRTEK